MSRSVRYLGYVADNLTKVQLMILGSMHIVVSVGFCPSFFLFFLSLLIITLTMMQNCTRQDGRSFHCKNKRLYIANNTRHIMQEKCATNNKIDITHKMLQITGFEQALKSCR